MCSIKPRSRKMYHCDHSRQTRIVSAHNLQVERLIIVEIQIVIKFMFSTLDNIIKLTDLLSHDLLCPYPKSRKYQRKEDKTCKNEKNFSLLICAYFAIFELICLLEKHEVTRFRTDLQKKISKKQSLECQTCWQTGRVATPPTVLSAQKGEFTRTSWGSSSPPYCCRASGKL